LENNLKLSLLYAEYYEKNKQVDSAITHLLPGVLEPAAMPVPFYSDVLKKAVKLIKRNYNKTERTKLIEDAIDNLYFVSFKNHLGESRSYYINFLNVQIKVAPDYLFGHNKDLDEIKPYLRKSEFYKKIIE